MRQLSKLEQEFQDRLKRKCKQQGNKGVANVEEFDNYGNFIGYASVLCEGLNDVNDYLYKIENDMNRQFDKHRNRRNYRNYNHFSARVLSKKDKELLERAERKCRQQDIKGVVNVETYDDFGNFIGYTTFSCEGLNKWNDEYLNKIQHDMNKQLFRRNFSRKKSYKKFNKKSKSRK